ncbi:MULTISPECIES: chemotaxis protein CheW [unclassified Pseudomonas]|jgi:chemotaxis-related protein WspD|uniref:chemotaxis protein CheW n=1 Tax=unclassified Pseudomonas TaxID=196821 RepID=UPI0010558527|nr:MULTISPECIES: chemotaxis protein CheW [unclassified Pseudomonas]MEC4166621.1 chemotaxis protein CheW [Pseudomonas sp. MS-1(2024)]MEC4240910.1 chemotaxis protein CheW [Pseudomonas sp. DSV-1]
MSTLAAQSLIHSEAQAIDDCWNRIGIYGDKSCTVLPQHIHCRNCAVYSSAATRLLDRYAFEHESQEIQASQGHEQKVATCSLVIFRLGDEWLALVTRCLDEVAPMQSIHSLPHQRSSALRGVANVRGTLVPCLSLVELLGLDPGVPGATSLRVMPRMLIVAAHGGAVVLPVDEVDGIHNIAEGDINAASVSGGHASAKYTRGVLQWKTRSLRLLDEEQLLSAITRSLT